MRRKMILFCVIISLILTCSFTAFAEVFDSGEIGSISVTLVEQIQNEPIVGAGFSVYYVATVYMDADEILIYDYTEDFQSLDVAIDDAALVGRLDAFVSHNDIPSIEMTTNDEGTAFCGDLPLGLYFVKQTGAVEGFADCTSFLVTVPYETVDGFVYGVDASPKTEVEKLATVTIQKVWNTNASTKAADSVTVQLLKDGNVIKTATLNEDNHWKIAYTNMPESDAYSIREVNIPKGFTATYKQDGYAFTVTNTSTLIQTGQLMWPIPVLAAAGMLFIAAGIVLLRGERKRNA